jgi:hypothetical protein
VTFWNRNVQLWVRGLFAAIIGGAANAVIVMILDPIDFNLGAGAGKLTIAAGSSALVGAALYLKQHPLPDDPEELHDLATAVRTKVIVQKAVEQDAARD